MPTTMYQMLCYKVEIKYEAVKHCGRLHETSESHICCVPSVRIVFPAAQCTEFEVDNH